MNFSLNINQLLKFQAKSRKAGSQAYQGTNNGPYLGGA